MDSTLVLLEVLFCQSYCKKIKLHPRHVLLRVQIFNILIPAQMFTKIFCNEERHHSFTSFVQPAVKLNIWKTMNLFFPKNICTSNGCTRFMLGHSSPLESYFPYNDLLLKKQSFQGIFVMECSTTCEKCCNCGSWIAKTKEMLPHSS